MSDDAQKRALLAAGRMAQAARAVVGGVDLAWGCVAPATMENATALCDKLRAAVDDYDTAILEVKDDD